MRSISDNDVSVNFDNIPVFSCLSDIDRKVLIGQSRLESFDLGSTIIERGDKSNSVYFLLMGKVHVLDYSGSGRALTYASLKEGDMFGEMSAIDGLPRSAWVCAITPCRVATLSGKTFLELIKRNVDISLALLRQLSFRLRFADERLTEVSLLGTEQRACMELIRMAKPDPIKPGSYLIFHMPTQANFANMIGSSRETVSRIFGKLKEESVIINTKRGLCILNRKRLEKSAFLT